MVETSCFSGWVLKKLPPFTGVLAAGGYGPGDALHQLKEPVDVTVDANGALIVADLGNARVMRWAPPAVSSELLQAVRG